MGDMTKKQAEIAVKCLTCKYILETCPVKEELYMKRIECSYWKEKKEEGKENVRY